MVGPSIKILVVLAAASALTAQPLPFKIVFAEDNPAPGGPDRGRPVAYNRSRGYGFDFMTAPGTSGNAEGKPFYFSIAVPEGNFNVKLGLGSATEACVTSVKAESRRLMLDDVRTAPGEFVSRTITVNVRTSRLIPPPINAPGGAEVRLNDREQGSLNWDDKLTLEFNGARPCVASVEVAAAAADTPTVFLAGDSTVTDQPRDPTTSWGQMLTRFFGPGVAIANHAESGETLKSFVTGLRLDKLLERARKGDYLFIQFGHNDEKENWPQTYVAAMTTYKQYLRTYVSEARRRGMQPVLVTSMQRRTFDGATIRNTHGDYPEAVRQVAKEDSVPLIDLAARSATFYEALGPEKSPLAFGGNGRDATHHSAYGAYELARAVVEGIKANRLDLAKYLDPAMKAFDPAHPDAQESMVFTASPALPPRPLRTPTVWVIGDSTVRNGSGDGRNGQWGWGDKIAPYFDLSKINVVNKALGGRSSRTFITEGHWDDVMARLQPGDFVMMQFGHNDGSSPDEPARARGSLKGIGEESRAIENPIMHRHETVYSFGWYMRKYVADARSRGAAPVICSPIPRQNWKEGHVARNQADYAGWSGEVAKALNVPFIDLNETIAAKLDSLGEPAVAPLYFGDHTHTSLAGAELNAACVVKGLKDLKGNPLGGFLSEKANEPNSCEVKTQ